MFLLVPPSSVYLSALDKARHGHRGAPKLERSTTTRVVRKRFSQTFESTPTLMVWTSACFAGLSDSLCGLGNSATPFPAVFIFLPGLRVAQTGTYFDFAALKQPPKCLNPQSNSRFRQVRTRSIIS